jgi:hypothetical protein
MQEPLLVLYTAGGADARAALTPLLASDALLPVLSLLSSRKHSFQHSLPEEARADNSVIYDPYSTLQTILLKSLWETQRA